MQQVKQTITPDNDDFANIQYNISNFNGMQCNYIKESRHIYCVLSLNQDTFAYSGDSPYTIIVSQIGNNNPLKAMKGHINVVWRLIKITEDLIASLSYDKSIQIWDWKKGQLVRKLLTVSCFSNSNMCLINNSEILCGGTDGSILLVNWEKDILVKQIQKAHSQNIWDFLKIKKSSQFITASKDCALKVWQYPDLNCCKTIRLDNHQYCLLDINEELFASAGRGKKMWIFKKQDLSQVKEFDIWEKDGICVWQMLALTEDVFAIPQNCEAEIKIYNWKEQKLIKDLRYGGENGYYGISRLSEDKFIIGCCKQLIIWQ